MLTLSRRELLAGISAAAWTPALLTLPQGVDATTLEATTRVIGYKVDVEGDIDGLKLQIRNRSGDTIEPVIIAWGVGRRAQQPWRITDGPPVIQPAETVTYEAVAPAAGEDTAKDGESADRLELVANQQAQVMVYDKGSEKRTITRFVPEVDDERR